MEYLPDHPESEPIYEVRVAGGYVDPSVADRWINMHGDFAYDWLSRLPAKVEMYAEQLELEQVEPLPGGTVSAVFTAEQNNQPVVLKLLPPWNGSLYNEAAALRAWDATCAPRLLANSKDYDALLMERIQPGALSRQLPIETMADIIRSYASYKSSYLPPLTQSLTYRFERARENRSGFVSHDLWSVAYHAGILLAADPKGVYGLVHGDLRTKNILQREDGRHIVIDPDAAMGDITFDAALWCIENPENIDQDCQRISEALRVDPARTRLWAHVLSVPEAALASPARSEAMLEYLRTATYESGYVDIQNYILSLCVRFID